MKMLNISPESVIRLRELFRSAKNVSDGQAIRIYISGFDFSGPEWGLAVDLYSPENDECCDFGDFRVIVESELLDSVGGLDVQYEALGDGGGFLITAGDPQVQSLYTTGCGGGCEGCHGCGGHDHDCSNGCAGCHGCSHD